MKKSKKIANIFSKLKNKNFCAVLAGIIAGVVNGLFGGGGGMIIVPMLISFLKFKPRNAHATALLIILPLSIVSTLFYLAFGSFDLSVGLPVGGGVIVGGLLGAFLLSKISSKWLIIIFSVIMAAAGVKMLIF